MLKEKLLEFIEDLKVQKDRLNVEKGRLNVEKGRLNIGKLKEQLVSESSLYFLPLSGLCLVNNCMLFLLEPSDNRFIIWTMFEIFRRTMKKCYVL